MLKHFGPASIVVFLTIAIFTLTKLPLTAPFRLQLALLSLLITMFYLVILKKRGQEITTTKASSYLISATTLFIVGATGWFFSPFFFSLYLLAIFYAFIFSPVASMAFVTTLVILFSFNIGEVDIAYDFLVVLSLLTTIPICLYLRKEYW